MSKKSAWYVWLGLVLCFSCSSSKSIIEKFSGRRSIPLGTETRLSWDVPKADEVSIEGFKDNLPDKGFLKVKPTENTTYTLLAKRKGKVLERKELTVKVFKREAKIKYFQAEEEVNSRESVDLFWKTENAERVKIEGIADSLKAQGKLRVKPSKTTTYTLIAEDRYGTKAIDSLMVKVKQRAYFGGREEITKGEENIIKWDIEGAKYVEITDALSKPLKARSNILEWESNGQIHQKAIPITDSLPPKGSLGTRPKKQKIYFLKAFMENGTVLHKTFTVKVEPALFKGTKTIFQGGIAFLNWNAKGAKHVEIEELPHRKLPKVGSIEVRPFQTKTYHLKVLEEDSSVKVFEHEVFVKSRALVRDTLSIKKKPRQVAINFDIFKIDKSNYPNEIKLFVLVVDTNGNFIRNLAPPFADARTSRQYFQKIVESIEGKQFPVKNFKVEEFRKRLSDYAIALTLDYSGSMSGTVRTLEKAAKRFIADKHAEDELSIVKFSERINTEQKRNQSTLDIQKNVVWDGLKRYGGSTALYAAGDAGIESIAKSSKEKAMLFFTDGMENASFAYFGKKAVRASELVEKARKNNTRIYPIAYGSGVNEEVLEKLANLTEGKAYYLKEEKDIYRVYEEFQYISENFYLITYKPTKKEGERKIDLTYNTTLGTKETTTYVFHIGNKYNIDNLENYSNYTPPINSRIVVPPQAVAYFDFDRAYLLDKYKPNLDNFITYLQKHPKANLEIHGHTDQVGTVASCLALSNRRANTVKDYLVSRGIATNRISTKGFGKSRPLWKEEDEAWKAHENRRIEAVLLEK